MKKIVLFSVSIFTFLILMSIFSVGIKHNKNNSDITQFYIRSGDFSLNQNEALCPDIKVYMTKENKIAVINIEDYVRGVVCAEMPAEFEKEALKAQSVAARTFALVHIKEYGGTPCPEAKGADVTDDTKCQVFMTKDDRFKEWDKSKRDDYWNKVTDAVKETQGETIEYDGKIITAPLYFAVSNGKTDDAKDVFSFSEPYLKSVSSSGEENSPKYKTNYNLSFGKFAKEVNSKYPKAHVKEGSIKSQVAVISKFSGGAVNEVRLGDIKLQGTEFRKFLNLNSNDFEFLFTNKSITIKCLGYGHNVGMSQWGANLMAKSGKKYNEIISHYYQGTSIKKENWK